MRGFDSNHAAHSLTVVGIPDSSPGSAVDGARWELLKRANEALVLEDMPITEKNLATKSGLTPGVVRGFFKKYLVRKHLLHVVKGAGGPARKRKSEMVHQSDATE